MKKISLYVLIVAAHAAIPCFLLVQAGCSSTKEAQTPPPAAETSTEEVKTVSADSKAVSEPREARIQEGSPNLRMSPTKPAYSLNETQPNDADTAVPEKISQPDSINDGDAIAPMNSGKKAPRENAINDVEGGSVYVVQKGDSISKIAHKHGVSSKQLMKINNLKSPNIKIGQKLTLPAGAKTFEQPQTAQAAPEPVSVGEDLEVYTVQKGDSVSAIAYKHGMTSKQLMKINNLKNANIRVGQKLQIKKSSGANAAEKPAAQPEQKKADARDGEISHKVKAGEFLGSIAAQYSVKIADIKKRNNISDPRKLRAGQILIIPVGAKKQTATATVAAVKPSAEASVKPAPKADAQKPAAAAETPKVEAQQPSAAPVVVPENTQEAPKAPAPEQKKAEEITEVVEVL